MRQSRRANLGTSQFNDSSRDSHGSTPRKKEHRHHHLLFLFFSFVFALLFRGNPLRSVAAPNLAEGITKTDRWTKREITRQGSRSGCDPACRVAPEMRSDAATRDDDCNPTRRRKYPDLFVGSSWPHLLEENDENEKASAHANGHVAGCVALPK